MKKIFGDINLTWKKIIIASILIGVYGGIVALIPALKYTSLHTIDVTFEVWILFGIIIIMNSKLAKESALKCFVFFLISQPLIYLVQDIVKHSHLFITYYKYWAIWTIGCIPMGYIGYYIKKDKWWGLLILTPILILLGYHYMNYLSDLIFNFPFYSLIVIFCLVTLIIYPLYMFKNKKIKIVGLTISILIIIVGTTLNIINPPIYSTDILSSGSKYQFDDTYKAYLIDKKHGNINIKYNKEIDTWFVHAKFKKRGKTKLILKSPDGTKKTFKLTIKRDTYRIKEIKNE